jgi:hypothetical protein
MRASPGPSSTTFPAIEPGEAVGMVGVDGWGPEWAFLVGMWVGPSYRYGGIGRSLIAAAAAWCADRDVSSCASGRGIERSRDRPVPVVWLRRRGEPAAASIESELERDRDVSATRPLSRSLDLTCANRALSCERHAFGARNEEERDTLPAQRAALAVRVIGRRGFAHLVDRIPA